MNDLTVEKAHDDTETDTLITNMENKKKRFVVEAIRITNLEDMLSIQDVATMSNGVRLHRAFGLHASKSILPNLSVFWKTYDQLVDTANKKGDLHG